MNNKSNTHNSIGLRDKAPKNLNSNGTNQWAIQYLWAIDGGKFIG